MNINLQLFKKILECHKVPSSFLYFARAFGRKIDDDKNWRDGFDLSTSCQSDTRLSDFSYNLQYFERNGRMDSPPWSLRQVGIYHQCSLHDGRSRWILLNPSEYLRSCLEQLLKDNNLAIKNAKQMGLMVHLTLLSATSRNWLEYMDYLQSEIKELVKLQTKYLFHRSQY